MDAIVLAVLAAVAVVPTAAWLHPGVSRPLAIVSALLALFPFIRGADGAMALGDEFLPFPEGWKVWVTRILIVAVVSGIAFLFATIRTERWWPAFALAALGLLALRHPIATTFGALVAGTALAPILRGGFGDPSRYRRIGAFVALLSLVAANALLVLEALIQ